MAYKVVKSLHKRLLHVISYTGDSPYPKVGILGGVNVSGNTFIVSLCGSAESIPPGISLLGLFFPSATDKVAEEVKERLPDLQSSVLIQPGESGGIVLKKSGDEGSLCEVDFDVANDTDFLDEQMIINVRGLLPLDQISSLPSFTFQLRDSKFSLKADDTKVEDFYDHVVDDESRAIEDTPGSKDAKKKVLKQLKNKRVASRLPLSFDIAGFSVDNIESLSLNGHILIDVVVLAGLSEKAVMVLCKISDSLKRQVSKWQGNPLLRVFNFLPEGVSSHVITMFYPHDRPEEDLEETRRQAHLEYFLPLDRPLLRKSNRLTILPSSTQLLINPHIGIPSPGSAVVATVEGKYAYHHYMQDNSNDSGWGCAYRSLQTIVSWFRMQGYIEKPIPTHKEIQRALVDCGDKEASFVGSSKWIGSNEVGFVLNQLYGITCKVMFVSAGSDLVTKGRELVAHFTNKGTPIMIGGGVLAHTILGVSLDEKSGETKFLILDPHYTGSEDLKTIQKKGWCAWKTASFWEKNSFYNLCLPQRPQVI